MNESELMARARTFLNNCGQGPLADKLMGFLQKKNFRLCVAGGFSRGKSHFINLLLGDNLLPESAVPTTAHPTEILYGAQPSLEIVHADHVERRALSPEALESFTLYNEPGQNLLLRIFLPLPLLAQGLVIIDTPGIEDGLLDSTAISAKMLESADAAIVMVSGVAPFSLTECAFINEYLLERKMPLVAAGLSYMDKLPEGQQAKQLAFILKRCHEFFPEIKILCSDCYGISSPYIICGIPNIKSLLLEWQSLANLQNLKKIAVYSRIGEVITAQSASLEGQKQIYSRKESEAQREIADAIASLEDGSESALEIRLRFLEDGEKLKDQIRKQLRQFSEMFVENAESLSEEKALQALADLHNRIAAEMKIRLDNSIAALSSELQENYGVPVNLERLNEIGFQPPVLTKLGADTDNNWLNDLLSRGMNLADIYAAGMPLGALVWPVIKPRLRELILKGQDFLHGAETGRAAFKKQITAICTSLSRQISDDMKSVYEEAFRQIKDARLNWLRERQAELVENSSLARARKSLEEIGVALDEANRLAENIKKQIGALQ